MNIIAIVATRSLRAKLVEIDDMLVEDPENEELLDKREETEGELAFWMQRLTLS